VVAPFEPLGELRDRPAQRVPRFEAEDALDGLEVVGGGPADLKAANDRRAFRGDGLGGGSPDGSAENAKEKENAESADAAGQQPHVP
jgi:hypothetical protein